MRRWGFAFVSRFVAALFAFAGIAWAQLPPPPPPGTGAWTGTSLTATPDHALVGQPVTFEAVVHTIDLGRARTGAVDFTDISSGQTYCAAVPLSSGSATCTVTFAAPGNYTIKAAYQGDALYNPSNRSTQVVIDLQLTPTARMDRSSLFSNLGEPVTFTATLTGGAGTVPGVVDFFDDMTPLCHVLLVNGVASCTVSNLALGYHLVYGLYSGDVAYRATPIAQSLHIVLNAPRAGESNVALASAGGRVLAVGAGSTSALINGDASGMGWGNSGGLAMWWNASAEMRFAGQRSVDRVVLYSLLLPNQPVVPSDTDLRGEDGPVNFNVEAWDGATWVRVASVEHNLFAKRIVPFAPVITDRLRINFTGGGSDFVALTELEAYGVVYESARNVALASTGAVASASSQLNADYPVTSLNNGVHAGDWPGGNWWTDGTVSQWPDWAQIDFNGAQTIDHVIVYTVQDDPASDVVPPDSATFTRFGITDFTVDGWDGTQWVPLGTVTGNNLVRRVVDFAPFTTTKIRVNVLAAVDTVARIAELEAWGKPAVPPPAETNWALASNGAVASASSELNSTQFLASMAIDGDTTSLFWNQHGGWADLTFDQYPDWLQVNFAGSKTIDHVVVYTVPDQWGNSEHPADDTTTFSLYGIVDFDVMGWNGADWVLLGSVHDNNFVKRNVPFAPFTTDRIRIVVNRGLYYVSRITEVQAWGP